MWDFFTPEQDTWYQWNLDGARLFIRKRDSVFEWGAEEGLPDCAEDFCDGPLPAEPPADCALHTVITAFSSIALRPQVPLKPYLVSTASDTILGISAEAHYRLFLPLAFSLKTDDGEVLAEFLPYRLSNAWFGDKTAGSSCYSLPASLVLADSEEDLARVKPHKSWLACDLRVRNTSKFAMPLSRVAVYTDLLAVCERDGELVSQDISLDAMADGSLKMSVGSIPRGDVVSLLCPARTRQNELFVRRGVNFLKTITGFQE